jgi:hypothetical protein
MKDSRAGSLLSEMDCSIVRCYPGGGIYIICVTLLGYSVDICSPSSYLLRECRYMFSQWLSSCASQGGPHLFA